MDNHTFKQINYSAYKLLITWKINILHIMKAEVQNYNTVLIHAVAWYDGLDLVQYSIDIEI